MGISKDRISPPLEAGASLLLTRTLPPQITAALDYVSDRLTRKHLHLNLIVVRQDTPIATPPRSAPLPSPSTSLFGSPLTSPSPTQIKHTSSASHSSTTSLSRTRWPTLPSSPRDTANAPSPRPSSPTRMHPSLHLAPNPYNLTLIHSTSLTPRAESHLRRAITKASTKFNIGGGWLTSTPLSSTSDPNTNDLVRRSLAQNEVVYTSSGMTLLSVDHVYSFKTALMQCSSDPHDAGKRQEAVDALRRLVLAHSGRCITKGYLLRVYEHVTVSLGALVDVNELYRATYGGQKRLPGVLMQSQSKASPPPLKTEFAPIEKLDHGPHHRGIKTPNGFEDITPVTRGEWCFLMVGEAWKGRAVEVQTC